MKVKSTILFVDQALTFGGSIVVLGSLVEAIDKKKFRPVVVGEMDKSLLDYHMQGQAKIFVVPRWFNYVLWEKVSSKARFIKPRLLFKLVIYLLSALRSLANVPYVLRLISIIYKENVDIVHVNNGMSNLEPVLAAMIMRRKFIVHFHGIETPGRFQKLILNKVHKYIAISEFLKKELVKNGFPEDKMVVIPNPVQETHALSNNSKHLRDEFGLTDNDKVFAIVGRIVRWKGHIEFLKAAFIVLERVPEAKALIVGDFSDGEAAYQNEIESMVEESGFSDRIIMTGYVKDIGRVYSIMDVCVHSSVEPEPFGLVIIEAMINGVPVVASNLGAPGEIIINNVNGYVIDPSCPSLVAEQVICLLTDEQLGYEIGQSGKEHVLESFNARRYACTLENIYCQLLDVF